MSKVSIHDGKYAEIWHSLSASHVILVHAVRILGLSTICVVVSESPPPSWAGASGSPPPGDNQTNVRRPSSDAFGWKLPKTPGRSPLRMDVTLDPWLPSMERLDSFPTISTAVPDDFLQPSISGTQRRKKSPSGHANSRYARNVASSDSSEVDSPSEEEVRVKRRRRRELSESEHSRSRSRSRVSRKRSRSQSRKYKRSVSPGGAWVYVPSGESKTLHSPDHRSSERASRLPSSMHSLEPRDLPTGTVTSAPRALGQPRALTEPAVPALPRDPPAYGAHYRYRTAPLDPRAGRPVCLASNPAPPLQAKASADGGEASPTEDSAYRRVVGLIRRQHGITEPSAPRGDSWRSSLLRITHHAALPKSSLALPLAPDLVLGQEYIDNLVASNAEAPKSQSASKLLQGLKSQGKVYIPEGRRPGPCRVDPALDVLDPEQQSLLTDLLTSGGKTLKFLSYQALALTANWILRKRDTVLAKVSRKIPDREARAVRSLPLWGESLFPLKELESLMEKVSKRKEANVPRPASSKRPPYRRAASDSAVTSQPAPSTSRREAPSSSWATTPQPSRRGAPTSSSSFRSSYSASRRGRSGRPSRRR
ncbi:serine/arginine repetitive matrix protein 2-like [Palaemon carinicauda]|uniref:serine/arginine repetitive matrix protein 2-like n=1 Tax=Palaemon carinicauda TaxID=392227 RepID=UPI0035B5DE70